MRIYDIISKKRDGFELSDEEIRFFVKNYVSGEIKDYHAAALLMAIYLRGMTDREMITLTTEMAHSGDMLDLSGIDGITVDKHSTGGVGDKTTLIVAPIVASLGCIVAKMSGRGLGHTGGTVDKLESIEGFNVSLEPDVFINTVKKTGICVIGQTGDLAPADKKLYALRDATATVGCVPLIASSIMSKKLAAGSQCIVLDVKYGSGAFMKTADDAQILSEKMVSIGKGAGRRVAAVISDMDTPLGKNIGNSLEVIEAVEILKTGKDSDLTRVCLELATNIVMLAKNIDRENAYDMVSTALKDGSAYKKFLELVEGQGGNIDFIENTENFVKAEFRHEIIAENDGYICFMDAEKIGSSSVVLGAGRVNKDDKIDYSAGIILHKKTGDKVNKGDTIAELFTNKEDKIDSAKALFLEAVTIGDSKPESKPLIYKVVS